MKQSLGLVYFPSSSVKTYIFSLVSLYTFTLLDFWIKFWVSLCPVIVFTCNCIHTPRLHMCTVVIVPSIMWVLVTVFWVFLSAALVGPSFLSKDITDTGENMIHNDSRCIIKLCWWDILCALVVSLNFGCVYCTSGCGLRLSPAREPKVMRGGLNPCLWHSQYVLRLPLPCDESKHAQVKQTSSNCTFNVVLKLHADLSHLHFDFSSFLQLEWSFLHQDVSRALGDVDLQGCVGNTDRSKRYRMIFRFV